MGADDMLVVRRDGAEPDGSIALPPSGALVGVADLGGRFQQGAIFEIAP